jgi:hypothetical protein
MHQNETQDPDMWICEFCDNQYNSKYTLKTHIASCKIRLNPCVQRLQAKVASVQKELEELKLTLAETEEQTKDVQQLREENPRIKEENLHINKENQCLKIEIDRIQQAHQRLSEENQCFKAENPRIKEENLRIKEDIERIKQAQLRLKDENQCLKIEIERLHQAQQRLQEAKEQFKDDNLRLQEAKEYLKRDNERLTTEMQRLFAESQEVTKMLLSQAQNKRVKINNTSATMTNYNNINIMPQLKPVTDNFIQSMSSKLVADPEKPVMHTSVVPYVEHFVTQGLKESIVCVDASRNKIMWINGDENNAPVKDTNGVKLASKVMHASEKDFAVIAQKADAKFHELQAIKDIEKVDLMQNWNMSQTTCVARQFHSQSVANRETVETIGKTFVKASMAICPDKKLLTAPQQPALTSEETTTSESPVSPLE